MFNEITLLLLYNCNFLYNTVQCEKITYKVAQETRYIAVVKIPSITDPSAALFISIDSLVCLSVLLPSLFVCLLGVRCYFKRQIPLPGDNSLRTGSFTTTIHRWGLQNGRLGVSIQTGARIQIITIHDICI